MGLRSWIRRRRANKARRKVREVEDSFVTLDKLVDRAMIDFAVQLDQPVIMVGEYYVIGNMVFGVAPRPPWELTRVFEPSDPNVLERYLVRVFGIEMSGGSPRVHIENVGCLNTISADDVARAIGPLVEINFEAVTVLTAMGVIDGNDTFF